MFGGVTDVQGSSTGEEPLATTVSALLDEARWLLDEERVQGERLDTKLFLLAGVAGVILAIVAPMAANGFFGGPGIVYEVFYGAAVLLLAGSVLLSLSIAAETKIVRSGGKEVASPRRRALGGDDLLDKLEGEFALEAVVQVEQRMITTVVEGIRNQRHLNGSSWRVLKLAAFSFVAALLALVGQGITLLLAF